MSNEFRHINEFDKPREETLNFDLEVNMGDLVWKDDTASPKTVKKASALSYTDTPSAQREFAAKFAGVSSYHSPVGDTADDARHLDPLKVSTNGRFKFTCDSATFALGDLIGVAENSTPDGLENQKVVKVTDSSLAIGKVSKQELTAVTEVIVEIFTPKSLSPVSGGEAKVAHTVTAAEVTAGSFTFDTHLGVDASNIQITVLTVTTSVIKYPDSAVTQTGGVITMTIGTTTPLVAGDIVYISAKV